jgi:hypothetical protein
MSTGAVAGTFSYNADVTFPIPFPNACISITASSGVQTQNYDFSPNYRLLSQEVSIGNPMRTGVNAQFFLHDTQAGQGRRFSWQALGY